MTSINVKDFEMTLKKFIKDYELPLEVKRLVLKEIYIDVEKASYDEMLEQAKERENKE